MDSDPRIVRRKKKMPLGLKLIIVFFAMGLMLFITVLALGVKQAEKQKKDVQITEEDARQLLDEGIDTSRRSYSR